MSQIIYVAFEVTPSRFPGEALTLRSPSGIVKLSVGPTRGKMLRQLGFDFSGPLDVVGGTGVVVGVVPVKDRQGSLL